MVRTHDALMACGALPDPSMMDATVGADLVLSPAGGLTGVEPRKARLGDRVLLPAIPARTNRVTAAMLSGNADYWIGRTAACREAQSARHHQVLADVRQNPARPGFWVPRVGARYRHEIPEVLAAGARPCSGPFFEVGTVRGFLGFTPERIFKPPRLRVFGLHPTAVF